MLCAHNLFGISVCVPARVSFVDSRTFRWEWSARELTIVLKCSRVKRVFELDSSALHSSEEESIFALIWDRQSGLREA